MLCIATTVRSQQREQEGCPSSSDSHCWLTGHPQTPGLQVKSLGPFIVGGPVHVGRRIHCRPHHQCGSKQLKTSRQDHCSSLSDPDFQPDLEHWNLRLAGVPPLSKLLSKRRVGTHQGAHRRAAEPPAPPCTAARRGSARRRRTAACLPSTRLPRCRHLVYLQAKRMRQITQVPGASSHFPGNANPRAGNKSSAERLLCPRQQAYSICM